MSKRRKEPPRAGSPAETPRRVSRASSSPEITSTDRPHASRTAATKSSRFEASLTALVATIRICAAPRARARSTNSATTWVVRRMGAPPSAPRAAWPSPRRVTRWVSRSGRHSGGRASTTRRRTVLVPRSTVATRLTRTLLGRTQAQGVGEHGEHALEPERLDEHQVHSGLPQTLGIEQVAPARDQDDRSLGTEALHRAGDIEPRAFRQREVGQHDVEGASLKAREARQAVGRRLHVVARGCQGLHQQGPDLVFVLEHQDGGDVRASGRRALCGRGPGRRLHAMSRSGGKPQCHRRAPALLAADVHAAAVAADYPLDDREAESGTMRSPCREEWIEDAPPYVLAHPLPGVRDLELDSRIHAARGQAQTTTLRHGVDGVED